MSALNELQTLVQQRVSEPVAHELLREAWNLLSQSPRSSLILGVAALEVGVKEFVTSLVPDAEWLCFELPSPPVVKILQDYLPSLPVRAKVKGKVFVPPTLLKEITKLIFTRNRVTHWGVRVEHFDLTLSQSLQTIQATLYLLDYYRGHTWALEKIKCADIREQLK